MHYLAEESDSSDQEDSSESDTDEPIIKESQLNEWVSKEENNIKK